LGSAQTDEGNRARFLALGMEPVLDTPEEFSAIVKTQQEKDSALVKELDLKTQ
jgi:tripartite-type tricarboxylate transporter receptor subunit TctC